MTTQAPVADLVGSVLGRELPVRIRCYDGSELGASDAPCTIVLRSPDALRRIVWAPGELGIGRAFVAGDLDFEGDIYAGLALREHLPGVRITPRQWADAARLVGAAGLRPLPPPSEEARLSGRRHSKERDAAAISHHYDVSNEFYRIVLGPSMTYSCAVWTDPSNDLAEAQADKYELICTKLGLRPGMRLLDVGCGWGGMVKHAVTHHGVEAVGVTISRRQAEWAEKDLADAGLSDRAQIRLEDYRDVVDGPYDAISSIGMYEHVGHEQMAVYFSQLHRLLRPGGRLLNHGITQPPRTPSLLDRVPRRRRISSFIDAYVFPDGELHPIGSVVRAIEDSDFEVRHVESLREHYALTLRSWVANLQERWDDAVAEVGVGRARVWLLYMAASAVNFETDGVRVHQVLATRTTDDGDSQLPLRPDVTLPTR